MTDADGENLPTISVRRPALSWYEEDVGETIVGIANVRGGVLMRTESHAGSVSLSFVPHLVLMHRTTTSVMTRAEVEKLDYRAAARAITRTDHYKVEITEHELVYDGEAHGRYREKGWKDWG